MNGGDDQHQQEMVKGRGEARYSVGGLGKRELYLACVSFYFALPGRCNSHITVWNK